MKNNRLVCALFAFLLAAAPVLAARPAGHAKPVSKPAAKASPAPRTVGLTAEDMPYDVGGALLLRWPVNPADDSGTSYRVYVSSRGKGGWLQGAEFPASANKGTDIDLPFWAWDGSASEHALRLDLNGLFGDASPGTVYRVKVSVLQNGTEVSESEVKTARAYGNWFRLDRLNNLVMLIIIVIVFFVAVSHAKRKGLFIRRIAGLDAIDEAIGRATEMGKPIYYVPGIGDMTLVSTIASTFILGEVSKKVAQYDSFIKVPHYDPIVMTVCKEVVKQSYLEAGRPDSYRDDINQFISQDQFSYAASIDGMITREKPAACFFMGYFMAESLLLSEVGAASGAIQIAGTDIEYQLPFFFTSCDYTLIGEELYAAGAYLSKEPMLLSALKVQDFGKLVVMLGVSIGLALVLLGQWQHWHSLVNFVTDIFKAN